MTQTARKTKAAGTAPHGAEGLVTMDMDVDVEPDPGLQVAEAEPEGTEAMAQVIDLEEPFDSNVDAEPQPQEVDLPDPIITVRKLGLGRYGERVVRLAHKPGCPSRESRVESYPVRTPPPELKLRIITRCCDCAEWTKTLIT